MDESLNPELPIRSKSSSVFDSVIKGGTVIDPSQNLLSPSDVGISAGRISAISQEIDRDKANESTDVPGTMIVPGLIDINVNCFHGMSHGAVDPDQTTLLRGVTTVLDVGTSGATTFPVFRNYVIRRSIADIYALINLSAIGMMSEKIGELENIEFADVDAATGIIRGHSDIVKGVMVRLSRRWSAANDLVALERAIAIADDTGTFVMAEIGDTNSRIDEILALLRKGDIVTQTFTPDAEGILDNCDRIHPAVGEARSRGVLFNAAHGRKGFSFEVAKSALDQGFLPDIISSGLGPQSVHGPVYDLLTTLSKFLWLGLGLGDLIRMTTEVPAKILNIASGSLRVGSKADIAVIRLVQGHFDFTDSLGSTVTASQKLVHERTIKTGRTIVPWLR